MDRKKLEGFYVVRCDALGAIGVFIAVNADGKVVRAASLPGGVVEVEFAPDDAGEALLKSRLSAAELRNTKYFLSSYYSPLLKELTAGRTTLSLSFKRVPWKGA